LGVSGVALSRVLIGRAASSGKKAAQADAAKTVGTGHIAPAAPPWLVVDNKSPK
jgi:hypothetical protein